MIALFAVEVRRALSRRLVRVLIALAMLATVVMSVGIFVAADEVTDDTSTTFEDERSRIVAQCADQAMVTGEFDDRTLALEACDARIPDVVVIESAADEENPAWLVNLWTGDDDGGLLFIAATLLPLGAIIAGASLVGAEWSTGSMSVLLTWEPRRARVMVTKLLAGAILAALIAVVLQVWFSAAVLPTVFVRGTTEGADASWFVGLVGAVLRIATITAIAAVLGGALAGLARNTTFAIGGSLGYLAVAEPILRALKPRWENWFVAENIARFFTARPLSTSGFQGSTEGAVLRLVVYVAVVALLCVWVFRSRDLPGAA